MEIQLKQSEIELALKDFIQKQGIQLRNRTVQIDFTSGRKENGITANLLISDLSIDIPLLDPDEEPQPALTLVAGSDVIGSDSEPESEVSVQPVEEQAEVIEPPVPIGGKSLFS